MIRLLFFVGAILMPFFLLAQNREYVLGDTVWMKDLSEKGYYEYSTQINGQEYAKQIHAYIYQESQCFLEQFPQDNNWFAYHHINVKQRFEDQWGIDSSIYIKSNRDKIEEEFKNRFSSDSYQLVLLNARWFYIYFNLGKGDEALVYAYKMHNLRSKIFPVCHPQYSGAFNLGHTYQGINLDSSLFWFNKQTEWALKNLGADSPYAANALMRAGNIYSHLGKYDSAYVAYSKALKVFLHNPTTNVNSIQWTYNNLSQITLSNIIPESEAEKIFEDYFKFMETINAIDVVNKIYAHMYITRGDYYWKRDSVQKAKENYYQAIKQSFIALASNKGIGNREEMYRIIYKAFNQLGEVNYTLGSYQLSNEYNLIALQFLSKSNYEYTHGSHYKYIYDYYETIGGKSHIALENYYRCFNDFLTHQKNNPTSIYNDYLSLEYTLNNLSLLQSQQKKYSADSFKLIFYKSFEKSGLYSIKTFCYLLKLIGKHLNAQDKQVYYEYSKKLDKGHANMVSGDRSYMYYLLSKIFAHSYDTSMMLFNKSLHALFNNISISECNNGHIYSIKKGIPLGQYMSVLIHKAKLLYRSKDKNNFQVCIDSCLILAEQAADRALANLKNMNDRLEFVGTLKELVETRLPILLERGDTAQALELIERNRARTLHLNHVEAQLQHLNQIPPEDRQTLDSLNNALTPIDIELSLLRAKAKPTPEEQKRMDALTHQKIACEEKRLDVLQKIETNIPEYTEKLHEKPQFSVAEFRLDFFSLPENQNTACLSYFQAKDSLYAFVLTPNKILLKVLPVSDSLVNAKVAYLNAWMVDSVILQQKTKKASLARKNFEAYVPVASELYQQLIAPVSDELKGKSVIILPDNALWQLPFEALLTDKISIDSAQKMYANMEESAYQTLPYCLKISTFSRRLSLYAYKRHKPMTYDYDLVAFAPVFEPKQSNMVNNSLQIRSFLRGVERWATRSTITADGRTLVPLYETLKEIKNISKNFNNKVQIQLKNDATERALKSFAGKTVRYFHIATHGFANLKQTHLSGLFFYPDNEEDGALYSGEVSQMQFPCYLLTLSACETGKGKMVSGEGMVGLMYNFFKSGTENIVSSFWSVNDHSTAQLMEHFYRSMTENLSPQTSLIRAKKAMINSNNAHPYYWSAFNAYQW